MNSNQICKITQKSNKEQQFFFNVSLINWNLDKENKIM